MRHNIENAFHCVELTNTCFLLLTQDDIDFANEVRISMISNSHDCASHLIDDLLKNYFSEPRFLRLNDVFSIDMKEYALEQFYSSITSIMPVLHFKVKSLKYYNNSYDKNGSYIVCDVTTLIQEANINSYLPRMHYDIDLEGLELDNQIKRYFYKSYPEILTKPLETLETCLLPFLRRDIQLHIKPIFLIKGSQGCGKSKMIQTCSEKLGMNLLITDFADVQTLTSAQTEAKLRIVLHNAEQFMPCIVCLNNIQVFGKNSEGQKDERIISAFAAEINVLCKKKLEFPIIIIVTSDGSDIQPELQRIFIETIHMDQLVQDSRINLISWLLKSKGLTCQASISKIAGLCSDYTLADITTLVYHAIRIQYKTMAQNGHCTSILTEEDFTKAHEYIQSVYSDSKGVAHVPKVYWNDVGGLVELKHEITRRIQLPLLNAFGFGQSGLLLYGPPGTGKTLLAKAVATEYQLHFISIKGPEVLNMYVGQSEENVRQIFERARAAAPCIIFFDELDSLAPNRGRSGDSGGVMDRVVSQLLAEMDGLEESSSIFIIGATNRPDLIDPALLRPGRFDKMLYVGIHSDRASQLSVLKALTRKFNLLQNGIELEKLTKELPDHLTGADLYAVCADAWLHAARRVLIEYNKDQDISNNLSPHKKKSTNIIVELQDFIKSANNLIPSISKEEADRYKKLQENLSSR